MKQENTIPRRARLDLSTPAELAIRNAVKEVEKAGADVRLTKAVILLDDARESVADFVDGVERPQKIQSQSSIDTGDRFKNWLEERIESYEQEKEIHGDKERIKARLSMLNETLENYNRWQAIPPIDTGVEVDLNPLYNYLKEQQQYEYANQVRSIVIAGAKWASSGEAVEFAEWTALNHGIFNPFNTSDIKNPVKWKHGDNELTTEQLYQLFKQKP